MWGSAACAAMVARPTSCLCCRMLPARYECTLDPAFHILLTPCNTLGKFVLKVVQERCQHRLSCVLSCVVLGHCGQEGADPHRGARERPHKLGASS